MKTNCWEFKECGREPGGLKARECGVCPAALEWTLNGAHGGKNAGRACWVIAGTYCGGCAKGTHADKLDTCEICDFFVSVQKEENGGVYPRFELYDKMNLNLKPVKLPKQFM